MKIVQCLSLKLARYYYYLSARQEKNASIATWKCLMCRKLTIFLLTEITERVRSRWPGMARTGQAG